ncbi:6674_t:CDS:2 [Dentiscutata erythropus]|uniref:6674_t:CDS:1 n=1 Tax=Dentiscutata erythropus TaxID=1348616 RepID=A0A9N9FBN2_9GLOM|nr:6674_t:CDS:2 [Dentiscutata erythropus]
MILKRSIKNTYVSTFSGSFDRSKLLNYSKSYYQEANCIKSQEWDFRGDSKTMKIATSKGDANDTTKN